MGQRHTNFSTRRASSRLLTSPRVRALVTLILTCAAVSYGVSVLVLVAPESPARDEMLLGTRHITHPYFDQVWTLFAPTPPDTSRDWVVSVKYGDVGSTRELVSQESNATKDLIVLAKSARWAPSRMIGFPLALQDWVAKYVNQRQAVKALPAAQRDRGLASVEAGFEPVRREVQRFGSWYAANKYAGRSITAIRMRLLEFPDRPFSKRGTNYMPPTVMLWDSSWMPYVSGVGSH